MSQERSTFGISLVPSTGNSATVTDQKEQTQRHPSFAYGFPPRNLMQYGETVNDHIATGKREYAILDALISEFAIRVSTVLDAGCSNARVLRWFEDNEQTEEAWGVDIDARRIAWAFSNFDGKFHFASVTTAPNFPFSDQYFDFIYLFSIFTHLDDTWTAWVQELRRVVKIGGHVLITLNDETCAKGRMERKDSVGQILLAEPKFAAFMEKGGMYSYHVDPNGVLFTAISSETFRKATFPFFEIVTTREMMGGQTGYLLKRQR